MSTATRANPPSGTIIKLKALAIKKAQVHVVGSPAFSIDGTPVFIDVEGGADPRFLLPRWPPILKQGSPVERSIWADGPGTIWHVARMPIYSKGNRQATA